MNELIARYAPLLLQGLEETLYMTVFSTVLAYVFGLPLGVLVYVTKDGGIHPNRPLNRVLSWFINLIRSVPFLILDRCTQSHFQAHRRYFHRPQVLHLCPGGSCCSLCGPDGGVLPGRTGHRRDRSRQNHGRFGSADHHKGSAAGKCTLPGTGTFHLRITLIGYRLWPVL